MVGGLKRALYDVTDRCLPGGVPRTVHGEQMHLSVRAAVFYRHQDESEKAAFLRLHCRPHSTTLDIGANFGVFTVVMARAVGAGGRVLAFEPTPSTCAALRRTVAQNGCEDIVDVREAAASSAAGTGRLHLSAHVGDMSNSLIAHHARSSRKLPVTLVTIDGVRNGADVSCVKIDAEGSELDILLGSEMTLGRCRPALTIEIHPWLMSGGDRVLIWELLERAAYVIWLGDRRLEREPFLSRDDPFEIYALPSEKSGGF